jgi:hypothetical protein
MEYEVYDARNPARADGPYEDKVLAQQVADQLNAFVYRNGAVGKALPEAEVTGPFFVRSVTVRQPSGRGITVMYDGANDPHLDFPRVL